MCLHVDAASWVQLPSRHGRPAAQYGHAASCHAAGQYAAGHYAAGYYGDAPRAHVSGDIWSWEHATPTGITLGLTLAVYT